MIKTELTRGAKSPLFYTICQNNSGGYFVKNDVVGTYLIVEALSNEDAYVKLAPLIMGSQSHNDISGYRWDLDGLKGTRTPEIRDRQYPNWDEVLQTSDLVYVYYLDGRRLKVWREETNEKHPK